MFGNTMLAIAVAAVLYGMYRSCRTTLAELRGESRPAPMPWQRLLLQPHRLDGHTDPGEADARQRLLDASERQVMSLQATLAERDRQIVELQTRLRQPALGPQDAERHTRLTRDTEHRSQDTEHRPDDDELRPTDTGRRPPAAARGLADPFDRVPGKDDLRVVRGIGKRMQRLLNGMGVTTLAQLAALERSHIDRVAARLEGSGHDIDAENWVGQARQVLARRRRAHERG